MKNEKKWYDYLWIGELLYWVLGLCNILFAWLGMLFFTIPMLVALIGGSKAYCNRFCGRGQLLGLLGEKLSRNAPPPRFLRSRWFRYGFLAFFLVMFELPWQWARVDMVAPWIAQFAFGFYGVMLTSTVLGLVTMVLFRPRSWCVYCPMGTMTQGICMLKQKKEDGGCGGESQKNCGAAAASRQ